MKHGTHGGGGGGGHDGDSPRQMKEPEKMMRRI